MNISCSKYPAKIFWDIYHLRQDGNPSLCLCFCLCICLSDCLSLCLCLSVCLSLSVCHSVFICLSVSVCLCLSVSLSLPVSLCSPWYNLPGWLGVEKRNTLLTLCLCLCLSQPLSLSLSVSVCLSPVHTQTRTRTRTHKHTWCYAFECSPSSVCALSNHSNSPGQRARCFPYLTDKSIENRKLISCAWSPAVRHWYQSR